MLDDLVDRTLLVGCVYSYSPHVLYHHRVEFSGRFCGLGDYLRPLPVPPKYLAD